MNIAIVATSFLTDGTLKKYFLPSELKTGGSLHGKIALKHSYCDTDFQNTVIAYTDSGRPFVSNDPGLFCSISHSFELAIASSAEYNMGVDVEKIRSHDPALLNHIATVNEANIVSGEDINTLVTKIWVAKEAVVKAIGVDIDYSFRDIEIVDENDDVVSAQANDSFWEVKCIVYNGYIIGVCVPRGMLSREKIHYTYLQ
jgi:4'-phosphopantetheinyl transferase